MTRAPTNPVPRVSRGIPRAFSILELSLTLVLLLLLATLIIPALGTLRAEETADRAKAELAAALADARSLAQSRNAPVLVELAPPGAANAETELTATVLQSPEAAAALLAPDEPDGAAGFAVISDVSTSPEASPSSEPLPRPRRLALLPLGVALTRQSGSTIDSSTLEPSSEPFEPDPATPAVAPTTPIPIALIFPDGTCAPLAPSSRPLELSIPRPGRPPERLRVTINPWFSTPTFSDIVEASPTPTEEPTS
jgi:type II secretory pathway pseudopilin PulG